MDPKQPTKKKKMTAAERRAMVREARKNLKEYKGWVDDPSRGRYRKSFYGETLAEAKQAHQDYVNPPLQTADEIGDGVANLPLRENSVPWWYLHKYKPLKSKLATNSKHAIDIAARHLLPELWDVMIWDLKATMLEEVLQIIEERPTCRNKSAKAKWIKQSDGTKKLVEPVQIYQLLAGSTVNKCRRLGLALNSLAYEELGESRDERKRVSRINPDRVPMREELPREVVIYTPTMMRALFNASRGRICHVPVLLMGFAGLRVSESLGATGAELLPDGTFEVSYQQTPDGGRTKKLKTSTSRRDLPLPKGMLDELRPYAFAKGERLARGEDRMVDDKIVYGGHLDLDHVNESIERVCRSLGLPVLTSHMLRHSFSSWLDENGCPRSVSLALMGHSTKHVEDRYKHASREAKAEWMGRLWEASLAEYDGPEMVVREEKSAPVPQEKLGNKGERNGRSTLTLPQVREIRRRLANEETAVEIARDMNLSPRTVRHVRDGSTWAGVA